MYTNVHCGTVYNSKHLEPTQMPINDRLDRENVTHIHHGILCIHKKRWVHVLCRDMDESGNHHSQQTNTEQKIKYHMFSLIGGCWTWEHMSTGRGASHTGVSGGELGEEQQGVGSWGEITWGEMPDIGDREEGRKTHCHVCTYTTILHVLHMYPKT